jgi:hypothetical protein
VFRSVCSILIEHSGCNSLVLSTKVTGVVHGYTYIESEFGSQFFCAQVTVSSPYSISTIH